MLQLLQLIPPPPVTWIVLTDGLRKKNGLITRVLDMVRKTIIFGESLYAREFLLGTVFTIFNSCVDLTVQRDER